MGSLVQLTLNEVEVQRINDICRATGMTKTDIVKMYLNGLPDTTFEDGLIPANGVVEEGYDWFYKRGNRLCELFLANVYFDVYGNMYEKVGSRYIYFGSAKDTLYRGTAGATDGVCMEVDFKDLRGKLRGYYSNMSDKDVLLG